MLICLLEPLLHASGKWNTRSELEESGRYKRCEGFECVEVAFRRAKKIAEGLRHSAKPSFHVVSRKLVGPPTGVGALRFVFRLRDYAIKRSCGNIAAVHHADAAERISGIRSALPSAAAVSALEYHAGLAAGGEQTFMATVVSHGGDVLIRQPCHYVIPALARIRAVEGAFAGGDDDLPIRRHSDASNVNRIRSQPRGLPRSPRIRGNQHRRAGCGHYETVLRLHGNEILLPGNRAAYPYFAMILAAEESGRSRSEPMGWPQIGIVDPPVKNGMCADGGAHSLLPTALQCECAQDALRNHHFVDWVPDRTTCGQFKDAFIGSGDQRSVAGLLQSEDIAAVQAQALLLPALSAIVCQKHTAEFTVIHQADIQRIGFFTIRQNSAYVTMGISVIGGSKCRRRVIAGQDAAAIRSQ